MYNYPEADDSDRIVAGGAGVVYVRVIQRPDPHGGYNALFRVPNRLDLYHVHFFPMGTRVSVIRYFAGDGLQGHNVISHPGGGALRNNFQTLINECADFPNHQRLLRSFHRAIQGLPRNPAGQLI